MPPPLQKDYGSGIKFLIQRIFFFGLLTTTPQLDCEYKTLSVFHTRSKNICPDDSINDHRRAASTKDITIINAAFGRMTATLMTVVVSLK